MTDKQDILGSIPSYTNSPKGVFRDIDHYRVILANVTKALVKGSRDGKRSSASSYLFDTLHVEFSVHYATEELFLDHLNSKIILRAPKKARETEKDLLTRRMFYIGHLMREVEAMKTIGVTQIYLALQTSGRQKLEQQRRKFSPKTKQK